MCNGINTKTLAFNNIFKFTKNNFFFLCDDIIVYYFIVLYLSSKSINIFESPLILTGIVVQSVIYRTYK